MAGLLKLLSKSRFDILIEETIAVSKGLNAEALALEPEKNSRLDVKVRLPKLTLNVLEQKINDKELPERVLEIGLEDIVFFMYSESKPVYSLQTINLRNLYILDP